jgi:hypothetical protein
LSTWPFWPGAHLSISVPFGQLLLEERRAGGERDAGAGGRAVGGIGGARRLEQPVAGLERAPAQRHRARVAGAARVLAKNATYGLDLGADDSSHLSELHTHGIWKSRDIKEFIVQSQQ